MKSAYQIDIITKIKRIREEHHYSQMKLANELNISCGQLGNIESPKTNYKYTLRQLKIICELFKIQIEQIFFEESDYKENDIINVLINKIIKYENK